MTSILISLKENRNTFKYFVINSEGIRYPFKTDKVSKAYLQTGNNYRVTRNNLALINNIKIKVI